MRGGRKNLLHKLPERTQRLLNLELLHPRISNLFSKSSQNVLPITPEMKANMVSGKPLKWKVTAFDADGKEIANSGMEQFKVK